jgi:hypothetical protein
VSTERGAPIFEQRESAHSFATKVDFFSKPYVIAVIVIGLRGEL